MSKVIVKHTWGTRIFNSVSDALEFMRVCADNQVKFEVEYRTT